jgi:hypothetical protein
MRTKTILLSGVVAALSSASLMAQVYSLNAVGYINVSVPVGFSIIGDQLYANGQGNAQFISPLLDSQLLDGNHNGVTIFKYDPVNGFNDTMYVVGTGPGTASWQGAATTSTMNPGESIFIQVPPAVGAFTLTFVGTVPQGTLPVSIQKGFNLISSIVPQSAAIDSVMGLTPTVGDTIFFYDPVNGYNETYYWTGSWQAPGGFPAVPTPNVAQGFFYQNNSGASETWNRTFNVN